MQVNEIVLHGRQNHHTAGSTFQLKLEDLVMCLSHCVIIRIHGYDLFSAQCPVYKLWLLLYWHRYTVMFLFITVLQISSCHSLNHLEFFVKTASNSIRCDNHPFSGSFPSARQSDDWAARQTIRTVSILDAKKGLQQRWETWITNLRLWNIYFTRGLFKTFWAYNLTAIEYRDWKMCEYDAFAKFQRAPLKFRTKYLSQTLNDIILHSFRFQVFSDSIAHIYRIWMLLNPWLFIRLPLILKWKLWISTQYVTYCKLAIYEHRAII